jgi:hypothetical protein
MNNEKTCRAAFVLKTYRVTPSSGTGGSITPDTQQTVKHGESTISLSLRIPDIRAH